MLPNANTQCLPTVPMFNECFFPPLPRSIKLKMIQPCKIIDQARGGSS